MANKPTVENLELKKFFRSKKVLITGHTGFKGSWLTQILVRWGAKVAGVSLKPEYQPNLFDTLKLRAKIHNYYVDIRDYEKLKSVFIREKPEIVIHLAAQAIVRESYNDPLKTISVNSLGTSHVLHAIKESGRVKAAVIITTDKVYENREWIYAYREDDVLGGHDPYSASKSAAEIIIKSYIKSFFNPSQYKKSHNTLVAVARAGNVIGGGDWARDRIIPDLVRAIYEKKKDVIVRNPKAVRPWQHVLEPLSGYIILAHKLYFGNIDSVGAWNFGPEEQNLITVEELIKRYYSLLGRGGYKIKPDYSKHESTLLKLDISKAKAYLGWRPTLSLNETAAYIHEWYRTFYERPRDIISLTNHQIDSFFL